jgi:hypothetical protein
VIRYQIPRYCIDRYCREATLGREASESRYFMPGNSAVHQTISMRCADIRNSSCYTQDLFQIMLTKVWIIQVKEDEMGRACSTNGGEAGCI